MHRHTFTLWLLCSGSLVLGCSEQSDAVPTVPSAPSFDRESAGHVAAGAPLPGLSAAERRRFERGGEFFDVEFEAVSGLGPLFNEVSCAECHEDPVRGGSGDEVEIHATGPELADICRATASEAEFRTQPLMGLRLLPHFMHDGRAQTVEAAIQAHGGEAATSRARFNDLSDAQRNALLAFLRSL